MENAKHPPPPDSPLCEDSTTRERLHHWVTVLKWALDNPGAAPPEFERFWWQLILKHGSDVYDEVIYSVGADPSKPGFHPENDAADVC